MILEAQSDKYLAERGTQKNTLQRSADILRMVIALVTPALNLGVKEMISSCPT